jgi:hypothetical protein
MAIAFDAQSTGNSSTIATTVAHTCTGTNLILWVSVQIYKAASSQGDNLVGVTYNGVAMTQINKISRDAPDGYQYLYALINPATGTNNIVATANTSQDQLTVKGTSYTGARQSSVPDATTTANGSAVTTLTTTVTTIADNCWLVGSFIKDTSGNFTAGANTTIRNTTSQFVAVDSNSAQTPAGSKSMTCTGSSGVYSALMASFAPFVPQSTAGNFFEFM